jgi:ferrous iron transport protein B
MRNFTIGVVGNPNCGKTTLFNGLTGARQRVGNWPGVTVDRKIGSYRYNTHKIEVVDTPGIYSFSAASVDEAVTRDFILSGEADLIVNIVDASNIERNLYLTTQLLEMEAPVLVALNMTDVANDRQLKINIDKLARKLDCTVVPLVASKNKGVSSLKNAINAAAKEKRRSAATISYPDEISASISELLTWQLNRQSLLITSSDRCWIYMRL